MSPSLSLSWSGFDAELLDDAGLLDESWPAGAVEVLGQVEVLGMAGVVDADAEGLEPELVVGFWAMQACAWPIAHPIRSANGCPVER